MLKLCCASMGMDIAALKLLFYDIGISGNVNGRDGYNAYHCIAQVEHKAHCTYLMSPQKDYWLVYRYICSLMPIPKVTYSTC